MMSLGLPSFSFDWKNNPTAAFCNIHMGCFKGLCIQCDSLLPVVGLYSLEKRYILVNLEVMVIVSLENHKLT